MKISKKCQYALKAVFELAWRSYGEAVSAYQIAEAQHISARFMELILNDLRHGGYVESRRGSEGGYLLARDAQRLTVLEVIEYIEGPVVLAQNSDDTVSRGNEAFKELWKEVNNAVAEACENKTFADLVACERTKIDTSPLNYSI